jgi:hypothetical protein
MVRHKLAIHATLVLSRALVVPMQNEKPQTIFVK